MNLIGGVLKQNHFLEYHSFHPKAGIFLCIVTIMVEKILLYVWVWVVLYRGIYMGWCIGLYASISEFLRQIFGEVLSNVVDWSLNRHRFKRLPSTQLFQILWLGHKRFSSVCIFFCQSWYICSMDSLSNEVLKLFLLTLQHSKKKMLSKRMMHL